MSLNSGCEVRQRGNRFFYFIFLFFSFVFFFFLIFFTASGKMMLETSFVSYNKISNRIMYEHTRHDANAMAILPIKMRKSPTRLRAAQRKRFFHKISNAPIAEAQNASP